ncbi:amidase [Mesorhizobium sp. SB112]|uniref:amidase n=1 Tax=Mesorhizobium sp. SB112 TaxID=3151853 RepID=UPI0032668984
MNNSTPKQRPARHALEAIFARLESRVGDEKVFTKIYWEAARAAANASDERHRKGVPIGPLDGRIVSIKDLFDVAGEATTAGSVLLREAPSAKADAPIVSRLRQAGAVIPAKTNMTEFAFTAVGLNPHYGSPGNARDASLNAGGSSSGAGVSVAEGTSQISIGSDTGGSVRIPAALNGIVGFKPTARRVPLNGAFPLSPTLDSIGPLALNVADCALTDAIMAGETPQALTPIPLGNLRFAIPKGRLFNDLDPRVAQAFEQGIRALEHAGATLVDFDIEDLLQAMRDATASGSIASIEGAAIHSNWLKDKRKTASVDPRVTKQLARYMDVSREAHDTLLARRNDLARQMDEHLSGIDMLVYPTLPIVGRPIVDLENDPAFYNRIEGLLLRNPQIVNQFDLTAISLPVPGTELPVGLTLAARSGADDRLLGVAVSAEAALAHG